MFVGYSNDKASFRTRFTGGERNTGDDSDTGWLPTGLKLKFDGVFLSFVGVTFVLSWNVTWLP